MIEPRLGDIIRIKTQYLKPTQPEDGYVSMDFGPIEAYYHKGSWYIQHGNHRFYKTLHDGISIVNIKVVRNLFKDY